MAMGAETRERFQADERAYWEQRDELLRRYAGQWIAVVDGQVVAVGDRSGEVIRAAYQRTGSKVGYVARVGQEDEVYRIRRIHRGYYDASYHSPVPRIAAQARNLEDSSSEAIEFTVDTGADLTVVTEDVADHLGLWEAAWRVAYVAGVGSATEQRQLYAGTVRLADHDVPVEFDCRDDVDENILGRDVINEYSLLVCAKRDQVVFEWVEERG